MEYAVEPIVPLVSSTDGRVLSDGWGELLFRGKSFPTDIDTWREWYILLQDLVPQALQNFSKISINLDTDHCVDRDILRAVHALRGLPVAIEWTERRKDYEMRDQKEIAARNLLSLRRTCGFEIILDDIGAGEDNLGRLCALGEPDGVKLDMALFHKARVDRRVRDIVCGTLGSFHALGIACVVEGVETACDLELAKMLNADMGQGYFWSMPQTRVPERRYVGDQSPGIGVSDS